MSARARKYAQRRAHALRLDNRREKGAELLSVQRKRARDARRAAKAAT